MTNNVFIIPEEVTSEIRLIKGLYLFDIIFIFAFYFIGDMFQGLIHPLIQIPYMFFLVILSLYLTRPSHENPGKRKYYSFLYKLQKNKEPQIFHFREETVSDPYFTIDTFLESQKGGYIYE